MPKPQTLVWGVTTILTWALALTRASETATRKKIPGKKQSWLKPES